MQADFSLSPTEEQLIQWLHEGKCDAEIAVRIGITVGETKAKIEGLIYRLGVRSRDGLRSWEPAPEGEPIVGA